MTEYYQVLTTFYGQRCSQKYEQLAKKPLTKGFAEITLLTENPCVAGSIPAGTTTYKNPVDDRFFLYSKRRD